MEIEARETYDESSANSCIFWRNIGFYLVNNPRTMGVKCYILENTRNFQEPR